MARQTENRLSLNFDSGKKIIENLNKRGLSFEVSETSYTMRIKTNFATYVYSDGFFLNSDFQLMRRFKKEILENASERDFDLPENGLKYCIYNYNELQNDSDLFDVVEIDINAAYLFAFKNLGLISKKLFSDLLKTEKIKRLKILGSISSQKIVCTYENGKMVSEIMVSDNLLRAVWFFVSYEIDRHFIYLSKVLKNDFLFYYVDGIYMRAKKEKIDFVKNYIEKNNYTCKIKNIDFIRVTKRGNLIVKDSTGKRPFFVRKRKIKKYIYVGSKNKT